MYVLTAEEMQSLDRDAMEESGIPGLLLMENAGRGCAERIVKEFSPDLLKKGVTVVAGPGNNGGDGFVIARHLYNYGFRPRIISLAPEYKFRGDALENLKIIKRHPVRFHLCIDEEGLINAEEMLSDPGGSGLIVDAIFGTGLTREVTGRFASVIKMINASSARVMAVDIPSGISADTGEILGTAVKADITVTMASPKRGHLLFPGADCTGTLHITDIGIIKDLVEKANIKTRLFQLKDFNKILKKRPPNGHKGTFGHLLTVTGSKGKSGASGLVSAGALRSGVGLVTAATPSSLQKELASRFFEHMTEPLPETTANTLSMDALTRIKELAVGKKAVVAGPGLGIQTETMELARRLVAEIPVTLIADADMLTAIGTEHDILRNAPAPRILTPHPGEMSRLTGISTAEVQSNRIEITRELAVSTGSYVVLKGAASVCAAPDGQVSINSTGNSGMGTGGMGDVLAGVIGGLSAQGYNPWDALRMGVFSHGRAGDLLYKIRGNSPGYLASELTEQLRF